MRFHRLAAAGIGKERVAAALRKAYVSPVSRRIRPKSSAKARSMQRARHRPACCGARCASAPRDLAQNSLMLARPASRSSGRTRLLRDTKLTVRDEIENALRLLRVDLSRRAAQALRRDRRASSAGSAPPFFRMGNWIGGDRDGNPNVTAETLGTGGSPPCRNGPPAILSRRTAGAEERALDVACPHRRDSVARGARRPSGDANPHREASPIAAPSSASMRGSPRRFGPSPARSRGSGPRKARPYGSPQELLADLRTNRAFAPQSPWRGPRRHPARAADPGGRGVRLPSRHHRPQAEFRPS